MNGIEALRRAVASTAFDSVGLVVVSGPDAISFVQSLISQDLDGIATGETRHSLLLEPQGKLIADFHVLRFGPEELWLRCEPAIAPALASGLARFKIRVRVDIEDRSAATSALGVRGPDIGSVSVAERAELGRFRIDWPDLPGFEWVGDRAAVARLGDEVAHLPSADFEALELARIEAGVPRQPADIDEHTIAQEAGLDRTAVSFTKGCFVGQELVCRIDARGHVNRTLRRLHSDAALVVGDAVVHDGRSVGAVTSAASRPDGGTAALAMVRREVAPGSVVTVGDETATCLD